MVCSLALLAACSQQPTGPSGTAYAGWSTERSAAYAALSPEQQGLADEGRLVFSGGVYMPAPALLPLPSRAGLTSQYVGSYACPTIPDPPLQTTDMGTFYAGAVANDGTRHFNVVDGTFTVPTDDHISFVSMPADGTNAGQNPYVMYSGWSTDSTGNKSFDAGLVWQDSAVGKGGWYLFTFVGGSNGWADKSSWRLTNVNWGQPYNVNLKLSVTQNNSLLLEATTSQGTMWSDGSQSKNYLNMTVAGFADGAFPADGTDTTFALEINAA